MALVFGNLCWLGQHSTTTVGFYEDPDKERKDEKDHDGALRNNQLLEFVEWNPAARKCYHPTDRKPD